jgi:hypothetical protein
MDDLARLHSLRNTHTITEVVSGGATGADSEGERWAEQHGIPVKRFPAQWQDLSHPDAIIRTRGDGTKYDARAGFRRNAQMAQYADAVVLFPGGNGTRDMARTAAHYGLEIFDWRNP